jgi:hypothetical protein
MPRQPSSDHGPALYWRIMRTLQAQYGWFTSAVVTQIVGTVHRHTVERYLAFLSGEGIVAVRAEPRGAVIVHVYQMVRDGDAPPSRRTDGADMGLRQQALWVAMRSLPNFTPAELAMAASTDDLPIPAPTARSYIRDLRIAGCVAALNGNHYRLLPSSNTGPKAPIVLRAEQAVFDLNLMRTVKVTGRAA